MQETSFRQAGWLAATAAVTLLTTAKPALSQESQNPGCSSESAYKEVIQQYLAAMGNHSVQQIEKLFTPDATVVSTSVGNAKAVDFYKKFFPEVKTAKTELLETYRSTSNPNHYGASFIFTFRTHQGDSEGGAYADEFYFDSGSCKLKKVIMYENMKAG